MATILGIDPGLAQAAAVVEISTRITSWRLLDTADHGAVLDALRAADLVVLEAQHASPQMGVTSAFRLGHGYGYWRGVLAAASPRMVREAEPVMWRGAFGLTGKADGVALARVLIDDPERRLTHDEADAILLAWWGWRKVLSGSG